MSSGTDCRVTNARAAIWTGSISIDLCANYQGHRLLVKSIHSQVFDSLSIFSHLKELVSIHAENSLSNLAEAPDHHRSTAVGDADLEVIGGYTVLVSAVARFTKVVGTVVEHLLLSDWACLIEHLSVTCLRDEDPRQITVQVAVEGLTSHDVRVLLHVLFNLFNQKSGCLGGLLKSAFIRLLA